MKGLFKTVLMTAVLLIVTALLFTMVDNMVMYKARKCIEAGSVYEGIEYYNRLVNLFPDSSLVDDALYEAGAALWKKPDLERGHAVLITSEGDIVRADFEGDRYIQFVSQLWLKLINNYPHSSLAGKGSIGMAEVYFSEGDWDGIINVLAGDMHSYGDQRFYAAALKARAYMEKGQPEKGLELLSRFNEPLPAFLSMIKGDLLVASGAYSAAREIYEGITLSGEDKYIENYLRERKERLLILSREVPPGNTRLYGRITVNGEGLAGVKVTAVNKYSQNNKVNTFTDQKGYYCFTEIPEGIYYLAVEVPVKYAAGRYFGFDGPSMVVIDGHKEATIDLSLRDKFELKLYREGQVVELLWEEVPGAEKYRLYIGEVARGKGEDKTLIPLYLKVGDSMIATRERAPSSNYTVFYVLAAETGQNSFTLDCDKDYGKYLSPYIGKVSPHPGFILGVPYYGGEFAFKIEAVDSTGKRITASNERLTMFPYRDAGEIHSYVKNGRFEGAKDLLTNWKTVEEGILLGRLFEATFKFSRSAEIYYKLYERTGDYNYLVKAASMWEKSEDYNMAVQILEQLPDSLEKEHGRDLARLYFWLGDHSKAEKYFRSGKVKEMEMLYYLVKGDYRAASKMANSFNATPFEFTVIKGIEELNKCNAEAASTFEDILRLLNNPSSRNRDKYILGYKQFCRTYGTRYPYMKGVLYQLGSLYWDITI